MTDRETLKALLTRAGIPFTETPFDRSKHLPAETTVCVYANEPISGLSADTHRFRKEVAGYTCFFTEFYFDAVDRLINMGAYE